LVWLGLKKIGTLFQILFFNVWISLDSDLLKNFKPSQVLILGLGSTTPSRTTNSSRSRPQTHYCADESRANIGWQG
jgi:hypothetical protein